MSERVNRPISNKEMERRWAAVRTAMEKEGIDVLLMQNNNDHMGGYTKYFTDVPATNGYPNTIIFPRDDFMTQVHQGPFGLDRELDPAGSDGVHRGVKRMLTTPSYASAPFTRNYDPELACNALEPYKNSTIGLPFPMHLKDSIRLNIKEMNRMCNSLEKNKIRFIPSIGNFITIIFNSRNDAMKSSKFLLQNGVIVRDLIGFGLPCCIRVTIGTEYENNIFLKNLQDYINNY